MIKYDQQATINKARYFLTNDFMNWINQGGITVSQLSSPQFDGTPGGHTYTNTVEKALTNELSRAEHAEYVANTILLALHGCTDFESQKHKTILLNCYVKKMTTEQVKIKIGFSNKQYKRAKRDALFEFAERMDFWTQRRHLESDLYTLMVPKRDHKGTLKVPKETLKGPKKVPQRDT